MSKICLRVLIVLALFLVGCNAVANNLVSFQHPVVLETLSDQELTQRYQNALSAIEHVAHVQKPLLKDPHVMHLAIDGPGFFVLYDLQTKQVFYTREGHFHINAFGLISNNQGLILQPDIKVWENLKSLYVSEDGGLWSGQVMTQDNKLLGHIKLAYFPAPEKLSLYQNGLQELYQANADSGLAGIGQAGQNGFGLIISEAKEDLSDSFLNSHVSSCLDAVPTLNKTDRALDWRIKGSGFFVLFNPLTGEYLFSRQGHFQVVDQNTRVLLSPEGEIVNEYGYRLFEVEQLIQSPETLAYGVGGLILSSAQRFHSISPMGIVRITEHSQPKDFGQIKLAYFKDTSVLEPMGFARNTIYRVKSDIAKQTTRQQELFSLFNPGHDLVGLIQPGYLSDCTP